MPEFKNFNEVDREFYNLFLRKAVSKIIPPVKSAQPYIPIVTHKEEVVDVLVRFFKRSGGSQIEEFAAAYPVISIQNFSPVVDPQRNIKSREYYEGGFYTTDEGDREGSKIFFPIPLIFRYQVAIASRYESHHNALLEWFYRTFHFYHTEPCFLMNTVETLDSGKLGTVVPYKVTMNDVPREDKFYEANFEFELKPFVHLILPETGIGTVEEIDIESVIHELSYKITT